MSETNVKSGGSAVGVILWLTSAVLFVLQVCGVIHVSWWLVFAPILLSVGAGLLVLFILLIAFLAYVAVGARKPKSRGTVTPMRMQNRRPQR